jgi:hypothetical protein
VVMVTIGVITLHPQGPWDPELPSTPEAVLPSSEESSRTVCKDGDLLCTIPIKMVLESRS